MDSLARRIKDVLRWCRISRDGDDAGNFPVQQVEYMGKVGDAATWFPYGFHANVPAGVLALMATLQGNTEARVALPGSPLERIRLAVGEVVYYHPLTGSKVHFKANGDALIQTAGNTILITANGNVEITPPAASKLKINGSAEVTGTLTVGTAAVLPATVTSGGKDISDTHTHAGSPTAPTGGVSSTGVPN